MNQSILRITQPLDVYNINNLTEGTIVYNSDTKEVCLVDKRRKLIPLNLQEENIEMKANYQDKIEETKVNGNFAMSLYDLNKQIVMQQADLDEAGRQTAITLINDYVKFDKFFMLLGKEIGYYTVFMREPIANETIGEAVIDCLNSIGTIKSIDKLENNDAIEIWVVKENEPTVLYFFPYNEGVIICQ